MVQKKKETLGGILDLLIIFHGNGAGVDIPQNLYIFPILFTHNSPPLLHKKVVKRIHTTAVLHQSILRTQISHVQWLELHYNLITLTNQYLLSHTLHILNPGSPHVTEINIKCFTASQGVHQVFNLTLLQGF